MASRPTRPSGGRGERPAAHSRSSRPSSSTRPRRPDSDTNHPRARGVRERNSGNGRSRAAGDSSAKRSPRAPQGDLIDSTVKIQAVYRGHRDRKALRKADHALGTLQKMAIAKGEALAAQARDVEAAREKRTLSERERRKRRIRANKLELQLLAAVPADRLDEFNRARRDRSSKVIQRSWRGSRARKARVPGLSLKESESGADDARPSVAITDGLPNAEVTFGSVVTSIDHDRASHASGDEASHDWYVSMGSPHEDTVLEFSRASMDDDGFMRLEDMQARLLRQVQQKEEERYKEVKAAAAEAEGGGVAADPALDETSVVGRYQRLLKLRRRAADLLWERKVRHAREPDAESRRRKLLSAVRTLEYQLTQKQTFGEVLAGSGPRRPRGINKSVEGASALEPDVAVTAPIDTMDPDVDVSPAQVLSKWPFPPPGHVRDEAERNHQKALDALDGARPWWSVFDDGVDADLRDVAPEYPFTEWHKAGAGLPPADWGAEKAGAARISDPVRASRLWVAHLMQRAEVSQAKRMEKFRAAHRKQGASAGAGASPESARAKSRIAEAAAGAATAARAADDAAEGAGDTAKDVKPASTDATEDTELVGGSSGESETQRPVVSLHDDPAEAEAHALDAEEPSPKDLDPTIPGLMRRLGVVYPWPEAPPKTLEEWDAERGDVLRKKGRTSLAAEVSRETKLAKGRLVAGLPRREHIRVEDIVSGRDIRYDHAATRIQAIYRGRRARQQVGLARGVLAPDGDAGAEAERVARLAEEFGLGDAVLLCKVISGATKFTLHWTAPTVAAGGATSSVDLRRSGDGMAYVNAVSADDRRVYSMRTSVQSGSGSSARGRSSSPTHRREASRSPPSTRHAISGPATEDAGPPRVQGSLTMEGAVLDEDVSGLAAALRGSQSVRPHTTTAATGRRYARHQRFASSGMEYDGAARGSAERAMAPEWRDFGAAASHDTRLAATEPPFEIVGERSGALQSQSAAKHRRTVSAYADTVEGRGMQMSEQRPLGRAGSFGHRRGRSADDSYAQTSPPRRTTSAHSVLSASSSPRRDSPTSTPSPPRRSRTVRSHSPVFPRDDAAVQRRGFGRRNLRLSTESEGEGAGAETGRSVVTFASDIQSASSRRGQRYRY